MARLQKITPCLWFDNNAEEAAKFYVSLFPNSKIHRTAHYGKESAAVSGRPEGSVMTVTFTLAGQEFMGLNGGPLFKFTEAVSFMVNCDTQREIDWFWKKLSGQGGVEVECGWLRDRFGLSWQIVPAVLAKMMKDKDPARSDRVMKALLQMKKLDIRRLKQAYAQKAG